MIYGLIHKCRGIIWRTGIHDYACSFVALRYNFLHRLGRVENITYNHPGARFGEYLGDSPSYPTGTTCHYRNLSIQICGMAQG